MKILVVTLSNLGDVVLTLPVIHSLLKKYPEAKLDVVVGASGKIVFENDTRLNRVTVYNKKMSWQEKGRFLGAVRREHYDILIDLRYSLIGILGGSRRRNSYLLKLSRRGHRGLKHLASLRGIAPVYEGESFLEGLPSQEYPGLPVGRYVVAAVGSKSDTKKWPAENYASLLRRLIREQGCSVVLVGDTQDKEDAALVYSALNGGVLNLTGHTDFATLVQTIRRAALVITNDSAPLHIADSLGVPVLALFGPSDPEKYGPRYAGSLTVSKKLFCQPCERAQCRYNRECLKDLGVPEVYAKAVRVLAGKVRVSEMRILVIRLDRIGDLMLSFPAIDALRRRFPGASISLMTRTATRELFEGQPSIDEVIAYDYSKKGKQAFPLGYFRFIEEIMKRRFDAAIILHPGIRSYLLPFLAAIPCRIGYRNRNAWLLTRALRDERHLGRKHESQYALDLVAALTGVRTPEPVPSRLIVDPTAISEAPKGRWLALHPGASCVSKRWPAQRFRDLAQALVVEFPEHSIAVVGGQETRGESRLITASLGERALDLAGKLDLRQLATFLSHCEVLVSNDSGPVHIAAAVGTRVVSLFGRNQEGLSPQRWKPLGEGHAIIQKDVGCQVCLAHLCPIGFECLKAIEVEDVLKEIRKMIAKPVTATGPAAAQPLKGS